MKEHPDLQDKTVVITGANSGIGFVSAFELAQMGAKVIMACRNPEKAQAARQKILQSIPNAKIELYTVDQSDMTSVKSFADTLKSNYSRIDVLLNNAGVMAPPHTLTEDGFEMQLAVNHLAHFLLTSRLFPLLKAAHGRVVNVASIAHKRGEIRFDDLMGKKNYSKWDAYSQSKLANLLFTRRLAQLAKGEVQVIAVHPGVAKTNLINTMLSSMKLGSLKGISDVLVSPFMISTEAGAESLVYASSSNDAVSGGYYGPTGFREMRGKMGHSKWAPQAMDDESAKRLWSVSEKLIGEAFQLNEVLPGSLPS